MQSTAAGRVLVVDDDPDIRSFVTLALAMEGYAVREAEDGRDALAVLSAWRPDLILLDLMMPGMDGRAFRERQRSAPELAAIPVVMMSAAHALMAARAALQPSATLATPFGLDELAAAVRGCARARAA